MFNAAGTIGYRVGTNAVDVIDLSRDLVTVTIALPEPVGAWIFDASGAVSSFGDATFMGSPQLPAGAVAADVADTTSDDGY